jgi:hypothetical protein
LLTRYTKFAESIREVNVFSAPVGCNSGDEPEDENAERYGGEAEAEHERLDGVDDSLGGPVGAACANGCMDSHGWPFMARRRCTHDTALVI